LVLIELWCFGDYKFVIRDIEELRKTKTKFAKQKIILEMKIGDANKKR